MHLTISTQISLHAAYFQRQAGTRLELAKDVKSVVLQINPPLNPSEPSGSTRITVPVDTTFGSAHAVIKVPANATASTYSISVYTSGGPSSGTPVPMPLMQPAVVATAEPIDAPAVKPNMRAAEPDMGSAELLTGSVQSDTESAAMPVDGVVPPQLPPTPVDSPGAYIAGSSFTVADPRPPTAALTLTAPNWVKPDAVVPVSVGAESYIGSDVTDANISISWNTDKAQGTLVLTTNSSGNIAGGRRLYHGLMRLNQRCAFPSAVVLQV